MTGKFEVNGYGYPVVMNEDNSAALHCPILPCTICKGYSAVFKTFMDDYGNLVRMPQTSWEWCQEMDTCAATVDWDKVFGH